MLGLKVFHGILRIIHCTRVKTKNNQEVLRNTVVFEQLFHQKQFGGKTFSQRALLFLMAMLSIRLLMMRSDSNVSPMSTFDLNFEYVITLYYEIFVATESRFFVAMNLEPKFLYFSVLSWPILI